ncbi:Response regulator receiver domain-containing protein [Pseudomonas flavescens]|uniref:Response regulator receiver domain-containing protein n=1 Tax=Phytopseudomonas flavescens TaxID=29435 RepID=A0A1G8EZM9_9GAMM|nr:response regulator [Pseudomonas flavescens]SDH75297.1 Response regulator receiver domain-containing protein [Pseudomonas flavescens]
MTFTVLLAEDEEMLRDLLVELISPLSLDVIQCASADEALYHLEHEPVDLLLSDIRMPGQLDGWELAEIVWVRWPGLPVILTSGHMQLRADQLPQHSTFIPKPWKLDVLYHAVEQRLAH